MNPPGALLRLLQLVLCGAIALPKSLPNFAAASPDKTAPLPQWRGRPNDPSRQYH
jgi:hypothetical protein